MIEEHQDIKFKKLEKLDPYSEKILFCIFGYGRDGICLVDIKEYFGDGIKKNRFYYHIMKLRDKDIVEEIGSKLRFVGKFEKIHRSPVYRITEEYKNAVIKFFFPIFDVHE